MKRTRTTAILLLTIFVTWQSNAFVHLLLVPHTVCEHGKVVDARQHTGHAATGEPGRQREKHGQNHNDCDSLTAITCARTLVSANQQIPFESGAPLWLAELTPPADAPRDNAELFHLSPSNSPPEPRIS